MKVASALVSGRNAVPELAAEAVRQAMAKAGLSQANHVLIFLSRDFSRQAQPAILDAARTAGCLQVSGCTVSGLFTETGWQMDQPAAAAMVFSSATSATTSTPVATLSFSGHNNLPFNWLNGSARTGLIDCDAAAWSHGRLSPNACAEIRWPELRSRQILCPGLRPLGEAKLVEACEAYDVRQIGGLSAVDSLYSSLPGQLPPLHQLAVLRQPGEPGITILSANADGSLTLGATLKPGEKVTWAIRQPLTAEQEMRQALKAAVDDQIRPNFALMFSCIGRGPLFYGDDDRDLLAFREQFPGIPLLGAYGTGQIASTPTGNRLFNNAAITLLFESSHV